MGRPNVGKSTLFNSIVGKNRALVSNIAGVTRDYKEEKVFMNGFNINLIDTAGLNTKVFSNQERRLNTYTDKAIKELDIILFVFDGRQGFTFEDETLFSRFRKLNKPLIILINKVENKRIEENFFYEAHKLGNLDQLLISAEHRIGISDVKSKITEIIVNKDLNKRCNEETENSKKPINIAVIGRPNVGKSTLVNSIINSERFITGPESGLTRDTNEVFFHWFDNFFNIQDTAGARRKSNIIDALEKDSVKRTINAINFSEVAVLVLDINDLLNAQDLRIASLCIREGRALVLAINKIDQKKSRVKLIENLRLKLDKSLPQLKGVYIAEVSGFKKIGLKGLKNCIMKAHTNWNLKIATSELNSWLDRKKVEHSPPTNKEKRRIKLKYIVQTRARPPTLTIFTSHNAMVPDSYRKYLQNFLRTDFNLYSTPIRMFFKSGNNPYKKN